jgi:hypothetical protein
MTRSITGLCAFAALTLVAGCGDSGDGAGVGGVTAEEATQLNNAAEMLDASPDSLTAPEDMPLHTESNSAANAT